MAPPTHAAWATRTLNDAFEPAGLRRLRAPRRHWEARLVFDLHQRARGCGAVDRHGTPYRGRCQAADGREGPWLHRSPAGRAAGGLTGTATESA